MRSAALHTGETVRSLRPNLKLTQTELSAILSDRFRVDAK